MEGQQDVVESNDDETTPQTRDSLAEELKQIFGIYSHLESRLCDVTVSYVE